jgi:hypothetical protein
MLFFSSIAMAQAFQAADMEIAEACDQLYVFDSVPASNEVVPYDTVPAVIFRGDCGSNVWILSVEDGEGVLVEQEVQASMTGGSARIDEPEFLMEPDTDYILRITPIDGWGQEVEVGFSTSSELSQGAMAPSPGVPEADAVGNEEGWWVAGDIDVRAGEDPDNLSVLMLLNDGGFPFYAARPDEQGQANLRLPLDWMQQAPDEVCFTVAQEDAAGVRTTLEPVCVAPEVVVVPLTERGCSTLSQVGGSGGLLLALVGLLGLRRRD